MKADCDHVRTPGGRTAAGAIAGSDAAAVKSHRYVVRALRHRQTLRRMHRCTEVKADLQQVLRCLCLEKMLSPLELLRAAISQAGVESNVLFILWETPEGNAELELLWNRWVDMLDNFKGNVCRHLPGSQLRQGQHLASCRFGTTMTAVDSRSVRWVSIRPFPTSPVVAEALGFADPGTQGIFLEAVAILEGKTVPFVPVKHYHAWAPMRRFRSGPVKFISPKL